MAGFVFFLLVGSIAQILWTLHI